MPEQSVLSGKLPQELTPELIRLGENLLDESRDALGWLTSKTRNVVSYSDPNVRKRVQGELDHAVGLLSVAHLMSPFEAALPSEYWSKILDSSEVERLLAYRHIRRCISNGIQHSRPVEDADAFNAVMASEKPIRGITEYNESSISLEPEIAHDLGAFLREIIDKALAAANS